MTKRKLSILIIDDNVNFISRIISLLNEADDTCTIYTAHNYDEAFALLDREPDFTLLDIQLPGKSGIDILKHIKKSAKNCEVIMLSNYAGEYYRELCKKLGAKFFLDKTNEFELVPAKIKEFSMQGNRAACSCSGSTTVLNNR